MRISQVEIATSRQVIAIRRNEIGISPKEIRIV
jgi:hypothetical protein